jgi:uncharacterized protein (TIGR02757 family)
MRGMAARDARSPERLRGPLERLYREFEYRDRLSRDAVQYPRRYTDPLDREIVALLSSSLAYGRVDLFGPWIDRLLGWLGPSPRHFALEFDPGRDARVFAPFHYRFTRGVDLAAAVLGIHRLLVRHGSLRQAFLAGYDESDPDIRPALDRFASALRVQDFRPVGMRRLTFGFRHLFPRPADGGPCKRWHLFLRWMVRRDGLDFGDWPEVSPGKLLIPLDTHVANMADALRLTGLRSRSGRMVEEVTATLRRLDPDDPVKYDFALCHTRMRGDCLGRRAPICESCRLKPACRHWPRASR